MENRSIHWMDSFRADNIHSYRMETKIVGIVETDNRPGQFQSYVDFW